ncbi:LysR family transcriptional regulator [Streptomyces pactum]|uniref:LysR family transcriptional regulator n=1 Tax=Streptomyces pactum TaxID=68249 RepID=UPI0036FD3C67
MDLLRHLRYFRTVAEEQHIGRAAERLRIAQPSLSQRIQRLERELGIRLFDRTSRGVTLTPAGRIILHETHTLLAAADRLTTTAARIHDGAAGTLRAAVPPALGAPTTAALITRYRDHSPGAHLHLRELPTTTQLTELTTGTLEAGIIRHPSHTDGLTLGPLLHQPLGVLLAADEPLAATDELHLAHLTGRDLVLFPRHHAPALHDETLTTCARHGCTPTTVHEATGDDFTHALVLSGAAIALLPRTPPAPGTVWRPLTGNPLTWRTSVAWPQGRDSPAIRLFTRTAHHVLRHHAGMHPTPPRPTVHPRPASEFPQ